MMRWCLKLVIFFQVYVIRKYFLCSFAYFGFFVVQPLKSTTFVWFFIESQASPDSCYFCTGTPQCENPIDYNEVSPRACLNGSVCLKYTSTYQNISECGSTSTFLNILLLHLQTYCILIFLFLGVDDDIHKVTYRQCFKPELLDEPVCFFVKTSEEVELLELNYTLSDFDCSVCSSTNCNKSANNIGTFLPWIVIICLFLDVLSWT